MQHTLSSPSVLPPDSEFRPAFNVVMVYEDFETGKHAMRTYDYLVRHVGEQSSDCQFNNQMWKFDVLSIPKLREIAIQDAAAADIIVVSSRGGDALPHEVQLWFDGWLNQPHQALALVALFDSPHESTVLSSGVRKYLAAAAKRGQLEFFAQPDDWPGSKAAAGIVRGSSSRIPSAPLATLAGAVRAEQPHRWGINE